MPTTSPRAVDAECAPVWTASTSTECVAEVGTEAMRKHGMNFAQTDSRGKRGPTQSAPQPRKGSQNLGFGGVLFSLSFAAERKGAAGGMTQGAKRPRNDISKHQNIRYTISPNRAQVLLSVIFMSRYWPRPDLSPTRCTRRPPAVRADRGQRASSVSPSTRHRRVLPT